MLKQWEFWTVTSLAALAAILVVANMVMFSQNRQLQADVNQRAQYIQQSAQLESLYREIVKALADLSVRNDDSQLRELLAQQGITVSANPGPSPQATLPAVVPKKMGK
jgi:hypothetical protein